MRVTERVQYVFGTFYFASLTLSSWFSQLFLSVFLGVLLIFGLYYEGIRFHQYPFILGYLLI